MKESVLSWKEKATQHWFSYAQINKTRLRPTR